MRLRSARLQDGRRPEVLVADAGLRDGPGQQPVVQRLHEWLRAAEIEVEIRARQEALDQVDREVARAIVVSAQHILGIRAAITDVEADVVMLGGNTASEGTHDLAASVVDAVDEPDRPSRAGLNDGLQHADHRRDPDAGAQHDDWPELPRVEMEIAAWRRWSRPSCDQPGMDGTRSSPWIRCPARPCARPPRDNRASHPTGRAMPECA